jgi:thioredoxin 1
VSTITEVTADTFDAEVLGADDAVLVEFWAEWCPPCRVLTPILEQLAAEDHPNFRIMSVNSDESPGLASTYRVLAVPTMKLFVKGELVKTIVGAKPAAALKHELADVLAS